MKLILWILAPILGDDQKPSIKRILAVYFSYQLTDILHKGTVDVGALYALGGLICVLLGIAAVQSTQFTSNKSDATV